MILALWLGCVPEPTDLAVTSSDWSVMLPMASPLSVPCANVAGTNGDWRVAVDDRSGAAALSEIGTSEVYFRDAFGVVADRCWWMQTRPTTTPPVDECIKAGGQSGFCGPDAPDGFRWFTPGVYRGDAEIVDLATGSGQLIVSDADTAATFDLTPEAMIAGETPETWREVIARGGLPSPNATAWAATESAWVSWDAEAGRLRVHSPRAAVPVTADDRAPTGPGVLTTSGDNTAIVTDRQLKTWMTPARGGDARRTGQGPPTDAVVQVDGTVIALFGESVVAFTDAPTRWTLPGARGLVLAADQPYAWGNEGGTGILWRLGDPAAATRIDAPILGAGAGRASREITLVLGTDAGPVTRGMVDRADLDAIPEGTVGLAWAAFVESPRDPDLTSVRTASEQLALAGGCPFASPPGLEREADFCCAQWRRAERLEAQLDWLDARLSPASAGGPSAVMLGVNPSVLAQSRLCRLHPALADWGDALPTTLATRLADWQARGVGAAAVLGHSDPKDPDAWWVRCPDDWPDASAPPGCWDVDVNATALNQFTQRLVDAASLADWGPEPDWTLFGGSYEGAIADDADWTTVFPFLTLPDGAPPDALYFGSLSMNPSVSAPLAKELAPGDLRRRDAPIPVGTTGERWDAVSTGPIDYLPGNTFAMPYLYESRRSGLLFSDWTTIVSLAADFTTDTYAGAESPNLMNEADFMAAEQYLVAHVIDTDDLTQRRWTYLHLQDLSRINQKSLTDGWVDCADDACTDTALDRFTTRMRSYGPGVTWRPKP
jgi:hypothetical protein